MRTQANGEAIRELREERGLSLTDLARQVGISLTYMSRIENGDRHGNPAVRKRLADLFGTTVASISQPVPTQRNGEMAA